MPEENVQAAFPSPVIGSGKPKTAVVVIHGMGEQRPMETIIRFVDAVWRHDTTIGSKREKVVYSKPDTITGSFELRRLSTRNVPLEGGVDKRADFFEFYWAHLMTGNTMAGVLVWLRDLLVRNPRELPKSLQPYWLLATVLLVLGLLVASYSGIAGFIKEAPASLHIPAVPAILGLLLSVVSILLSLFVTWWVVPVAGDAARYLSPTPENVEARQKIREAGVDLLKQLHASGRYDRIVVVGHSLGSVIGYDVLNCAWGRLAEKDLLTLHGAKSLAMSGLTALERATGDLIHADDTNRGERRLAYRRAQRAYQDALRAWSCSKSPLWAVTDFVSLACPLSKAEVLIARNQDGFERRKRARELPTCPPALEKDKATQNQYFLSFPFDQPSRIPHFGAVFAPVVWTNVYFETVDMVFGDPIGGPVRDLFGLGIVDVRCPATPFKFLHTAYWDDPASNEARLRALRRAVNLKLLDDDLLWTQQATADVIAAERL
jgi:hypothetical protein